MMCDDEQDMPQEWRGTLRSVLDQPAPPSTTNLDQIIKLGRRRLLVRRLGATAGVLAAVAGIGLGAAAIGGLRGGGVETATTPTLGTAPTTTGPGLPTDWQQPTSLPTQQPYETWTPVPSGPLPAGATALPTPLCKPISERGLEPGHIEASAELQQALATAITRNAPGATVGRPVSMVENPDGADQTAATLIDVTDGNGTGSVSLRAGLTRANPEEVADAQAFAQGNCAPPVRTALATGTVLQLYPVRPSEPHQSLTQALRVYTPTGIVYEVAVHNWGSPDLAWDQRKAGVLAKRTGPGRATLPLTERQLAEIGLAVAAAA